ncbi:MAG: HEAT repeat domain-containing protein [Planctomycetota bacterium]
MGRSILALCILCLAAPALAADVLDDLGSPDPAVRAKAAEGLRSRGAEAAPDLVRGIADPRPVVALACLDLTAEAEVRRARDAVRAVASDEGAPAVVRRAAIRSLGRVGDYRDLKLLTSLIGAWPEAALALAGIGDEDAVPALVDAIEGGALIPEVAYALASFDVPAGIEVLVAMLEGEHHESALRWLRRATGADAGSTRAGWDVWYRREVLARSLGNADWAEAESFLAASLEAKPETLAGDLRSLAADAGRSRAVRTTAILGLGRRGGNDSAPFLLRLLFEDPDGMIRVYAAEALGRLKVMATAVDLCWYLVNDEEEFRKLSAKHQTNPYYTIDSEVSKALLELGALGGLDKMIVQLGEEHRVRVYHQAVRTLREAAGQSFGYAPDARRAEREAAAARWRRWFDENRDRVTRPECPGLADAEFRRRVRELVDGLGNFHFLEMSRARQMLTLLGELAVPELVAGLSRPEVHIRTHCAEVLGWIRARAARDDLAKALEDRRIEVRTAAARALALMGPGSATDDILAVLADETRDGLDVRIEAARALARAETGVAVPALTASLERPENDSDTFRLEAWFALAAHGDAAFVDRLTTLLERPEVAFRQIVADRLAALTGKDPGVTDESIASWRKWWEASRERYSPSSPFGRTG